MRYLVDTCVLSESTRPAPNERALRWLVENQADLAVDPIVLGELRFGILLLPHSKQRDRLEQWFDAGAKRLLCLPWEAATGLRWAELLANLRATGHAMGIKDSMIAASALTHGLTVATFNFGDFQACGVPLIDPSRSDELGGGVA